MDIKTESYDTTRELENKLRDDFGVKDGFDLSGYTPSYQSLELIRTEDKIIVGMLNDDTDPQDYFESDEGEGSLVQFRSAGERDLEVAKLSRTKKLFYLVSKYQQSNVHYSVAGTNSYGNDRFDVSHGCAVHIPCAYIQSEFRKMKRTHGEGEAYEHFLKVANETLNSYSDWCNGEVYGYTVLTFDKKGNEIDNKQCWGYVGRENAENERLSIMKHIVESEEINKLMQHVVIEKIEPKNASLPFKITKKGLQELHVAHVYNTFVVGTKYEGEDNTIVYKWSEGQDKPTKAKFEQWQKNHNVTADKFMHSRMSSDIKDVLRDNLNKENKSENKPTI
jgi:hypothetical protein